jgi:hypothetical protein
MKEDDRGKSQAKAQLESIEEMIEVLGNSTDETREDAERRIQEDPLSVGVRWSWRAPGNLPQDGDNEYPEEYQILLCTGGPAVQIVGILNEHCEPETVTLEYQDWFTPWVEYRLDSEDEETLLAYARQFYYGA